MRYKAIALPMAIVSVLVCVPLRAQDTVSQPDKAAVEKIVREYILQHPEVIAQAANLYQAHEKAAQKERVKEAIETKVADLQNDPSSPVTGAVDGVTIVEFFDYHCTFCRRAEPTIEKLIATHPGVRFVFKEYPILGPESVMAAKASLAANKQGDYLKFHQALLAKPGSIGMDTIEKLAAEQHLDLAKLKADMDSPDIKSSLERNEELGRRLGVNATPSFVIGSELVPGVTDAAEFEKLIAQAKSAGTHPPYPVEAKTSQLK